MNFNLRDLAQNSGFAAAKKQLNSHVTERDDLLMEIGIICEVTNAFKGRVAYNAFHNYFQSNDSAHHAQFKVIPNEVMDVYRRLRKLEDDGWQVTSKKFRLPKGVPYKYEGIFAWWQDGVDHALFRRDSGDIQEETKEFTATPSKAKSKRENRMGKKAEQDETNALVNRSKVLEIDNEWYNESEQA